MVIITKDIDNSNGMDIDIFLWIKSVNQQIKARGGNPDAFPNDIKRITDIIDFKG